MSNAAAVVVFGLGLGLFGVSLVACHDNPNTGLPEPGIRTPWRTYAECARPIEILAKDDTPVPHRVLSKVFVTCTHYVPNECDDALKSRACDAGGDAVLVSESDENNVAAGSSERNVRRGRHGTIIAWEK